MRWPYVGAGAWGCRSPRIRGAPAGGESVLVVLVRSLASLGRSGPPAATHPTRPIRPFSGVCPVSSPGAGLRGLCFETLSGVSAPPGVGRVPTRTGAWRRALRGFRRLRRGLLRSGAKPCSASAGTPRRVVRAKAVAGGRRDSRQAWLCAWGSAPTVHFLHLTYVNSIKSDQHILVVYFV